MIGDYKKRWKIWQFCPWWGLPYLGYQLKCITAVHAFLGVGLINDTPERLTTTRFIAAQTNRWLSKHPISTGLFEKSIRKSRIKSEMNPDKCFREVTLLFIFTFMFTFTFMFSFALLFIDYNIERFTKYLVTCND